MNTIRIGLREVGRGKPAYIIAEVGSNFDGDLTRAKELALRCKEAGADAYKIQNFLAPRIVSDEGFRNLKVAFQSHWKSSVVDVYRKAEFPREWVRELAGYCGSIGIDFMSSPYDFEAVDMLEAIGVTAHKIGSGEIDNLRFLEYVAKTGKPVIIGAGAATHEEVSAAVAAIRDEGNDNVIVLQCVTNYPSPIADANLAAMTALGASCGTLYGYSDHTIGPTQGGDDPIDGLTVPLGAVALGACVIEKHVTDDPSRTGPDHPFAMTIGGNFAQMVRGIRAMESALGDGAKRLMPSEQETVVIQRRGAYASRDIAQGEAFSDENVVLLRPAVGVKAGDISKLLGRPAARALGAGSPIRYDDIAG